MSGAPVEKRQKPEAREEIVRYWLEDMVTKGTTDEIGMCGLVADFLPGEAEKLQEYLVYFKIF